MLYPLGYKYGFLSFSTCCVYPRIEASVKLPSSHFLNPTVGNLVSFS